MNRIITIGREFGSGGRELGKRLAEELQIAYYDQEIIAEIAKHTSLSEQYVHRIIEQRPLMSFPIHTGRSFYPSADLVMEQSQSVFREQSNIILEMADKSDYVIVGRCADYILKERNPFRIFVYSEMDSRIRRCREKVPEHAQLSDKELKKHILEIDKNREKYYNHYTGQKWGERLNYDLCINTSKMEIKEMVPVLAKMFLV